MSLLVNDLHSCLLNVIYTITWNILQVLNHITFTCKLNLWVNSPTTFNIFFIKNQKTDPPLFFLHLQQWLGNNEQNRNIDRVVFLNAKSVWLTMILHKSNFERGRRDGSKDSIKLQKLHKIEHKSKILKPRGDTESIPLPAPRSFWDTNLSLKN